MGSRTRRGPGEVGAAAGTRNRRTTWWLWWIFVAVPTAPYCRCSWLKEENSEGEGKNGEEGSDSGVHFDSTVGVHARGEWGCDLSMTAMQRQTFVQVATSKCSRLVPKCLKPN
jgi:hypothetical protein